MAWWYWKMGMPPMYASVSEMPPLIATGFIHLCSLDAKYQAERIKELEKKIEEKQQTIENQGMFGPRI